MSVRSRNLMTVILVAAAVPVLSARAEDSGTRVSIRLPDGKDAIPDAQKVVEALEAAGGEHQVVAKLDKGGGQEELTLDLWGNWLAGSQIPQALRDGFPELATAEIQVSSIDAASRPKLESMKLDEGGKKRIIKKMKRQE